VLRPNMQSGTLAQSACESEAAANGMTASARGGGFPPAWFVLGAGSQVPCRKVARGRRVPLEFEAWGVGGLRCFGGSVWRRTIRLAVKIQLNAGLLEAG
jgi:hypothetical protein